MAYYHSSDEVDNWETTGYCSSEIQRESVHFRYLPVLAPLPSLNQWRGGFFEQSPNILGVTLVTQFTFGQHKRNCVERTSRALNVNKSLSWVELGFSRRDVGEGIYGHSVPHSKLCRPNPVHKRVLLPSAWINLNWSIIRFCKILLIQSSKGSGVLPQKRDWGPPPEGAPTTVVPSVLCKRPPTHSPQLPHHHSSSNPHPVKIVLQASYHRTHRGLRFRSDDLDYYVI